MFSRFKCGWVFTAIFAVVSTVALNSIGLCSIEQPVTLSALLDEISTHHPEGVESLKSHYPDFIAYVERNLQPRRFPFVDRHLAAVVEDGVEVAKITAMAAAGATAYGISQNLLASYLDLSYYNSDRNYHGRYSKKNYPAVFYSNSRFIFASLWGVLSTYAFGVPLGAMAGVAARGGHFGEKVTWKEIAKPMSLFLGGLFTASGFLGLTALLATNNTHKAIDTMRGSSYVLGALGGLGMVFYTYKKRFGATNKLRKQAIGFTKDAMQLFRDHPNDPHIEMLNKLLAKSFLNALQLHPPEEVKKIDVIDL